MQRLNSIAKPVSHVLVAALLLLGIHLPAAQAALVGTDTLLHARHDGAGHAQLQQLLDRDEVRSALNARGVAPAAVQTRIDALTNDEARALVAQIDAAPAGGTDVLVVGAVVFLALLFTDVMGYTDIFPFVKKTAR
jgi:hypothetical protein